MNGLTEVLTGFQPILEYASYEQPEKLIQVYDALSHLQKRGTLVISRDLTLVIQKLVDMTADLSQTTREHLEECINHFVFLLWSLNGAQSVYLQYMGQTKKILIRFPVVIEDLKKRFAELFKIRMSKEVSLQLRDVSNGVWFDLENVGDISPGSVIRIVNQDNVARAYSHLLFEMESLKKQLQASQTGGAPRPLVSYQPSKDTTAPISYKKKRMVSDIQLRLRELRYEVDSIGKILKSQIQTTHSQLSQGLNVIREAISSVPNLSTRMAVSSKSKAVENRLTAVVEDLNMAKIVAEEYKKDVSSNGCRVGEADMRKVVEYAHQQSTTLSELAKEFTVIKEEKKKMWNSELEAIMSEQKKLQDQLAAFEDLEAQADLALKTALEAEAIRREKKHSKGEREIQTLRADEINRFVREDLMTSIRSTQAPCNHPDSLSKFELIRKWKSKYL